MVGHNIQNFDIDLFCLTLNDCQSTTTMKVILSTDKKNTSTTFGILIDTITTQERRTQTFYEYFRFIDWYKKMNSSLEKLVEFLTETQFDIMEAVFHRFPNQTHTCSNKKDVILVLMYVIVQSFQRNVYHQSQNGAIVYKAENLLFVKNFKSS